jgi:hypothetical protein
MATTAPKQQDNVLVDYPVLVCFIVFFLLLSFFRLFVFDKMKNRVRTAPELN